MCVCAIYSTWKLVDLHVHKSKQGNTTNLNISFSMENEKRAAQVGYEPTTHCLRGRCKQLVIFARDALFSFFSQEMCNIDEN